MVKSYSATTGVDEFYYDVLENDVAEGTPERVEFLNNITVESPQEAVRGYGDNKTAEIAVSSGNTSVTAAFHKIPLEDLQVLLGMEKTENGLYAYGGNDVPPYVGIVFAKTSEDGSREYVGLPKGIFMRPNTTGTTKTETVEFTPEEITAQFMDREVDGFDSEKSVIFGRDEEGSTVAKDAVFNAVFGVASDAPVEDGTTTEGA